MKQYTVTVEGKVFTRKSERDYTHIVVGINQGVEGRKDGAWLLGYAGSAALAAKRASGWEAKRHTRVEVVEFTPEMIREIKSRKKEAP